MKKKRKTDFKTEEEARLDALQEKLWEDKLNHLYDLADRFPDDYQIGQEIAELERKLDYKL